ncbi:MAG TPA: ATP-binding protein [Actinomycetota bacterium]|jgi:signal transduction histidine kinase
MNATRSLRAVVVASPQDARTSLSEALEALDGVEVVGDAADPKEAAILSARLHPDLVVVAMSPSDEEGAWALPPLLGVAPGARVILTLLEEWTERRAAKGYDLREIIEVLREARAADDRDGHSRRREATLSMLAHDILTPTTAVVGVADLLLRYWDRFEAEERRQGVANIAEVGRDLASLVRGVVRAAAADAGSLVGDREPVELAELLDEAVGGIRRIAPSHTVELEVGEPVPKLWVDRIRVQEAVLNFLTNAVKYSPEGTTVRVVAIPHEHEVTITVIDQGPGIDPKDHGKLFKKFSRLHPEDTSGHGLGLYLVKAIVEAHGGRVWVEGQVGAGSTFGMALPATGRTTGTGRRADRS